MQIVRCFFGLKDDEDIKKHFEKEKDIIKYGKRMDYVRKSVEILARNPFEDKKNSIIYVFGQKNYDWLTSFGFNCYLMDKEPIVMHLKYSMFGHKLLVHEEALKHFDDILYCDLDIMLSRKENTQDAIMMHFLPFGPAFLSGFKHWKKRLLPKECKDWADGKRGLLPAGGCTYIRGRETIEEILNIWKAMNYPASDEFAMAYYITKRCKEATGRDFDLPWIQENYHLPFFGIHASPEKMILKNNLYKWHGVPSIDYLVDKIKDKTLKPEHYYWDALDRERGNILCVKIASPKD